MKLVSKLCLLIILFGCGSDRLESDPSQSLIDSFWQTNCLAQENGQFRRVIFEFSFGNQAVRDDVTYTDSECTEIVLVESLKGFYELEVTWQSYVHKLIFEVSEQSQDETGGKSYQPLGEPYKYETLIYLRNDQMKAQEPFSDVVTSLTEFTEDEVSADQVFYRIL